MYQVYMNVLYNIRAIYFMCVNMYLGTLGCTFVHVPAHVYWYVAHAHLVAWLFLVFKIRGVHTHVYMYLLGTFGLSQKLFSESAIETVLRLVRGARLPRYFTFHLNVDDLQFVRFHVTNSGWSFQEVDTMSMLWRFC